MPNHQRSKFSLVRFRDQPVVLGGEIRIDDVLQVCDSVEEYDTVKGVWSYLEPMQEARTECSAVTIKEQFIYVFGGKDSASNELHSIERYEYD